MLTPEVRVRVCLVVVSLALGCRGGDPPATIINEILDWDRDGHEVPADCDDGDPQIYPGAPDDPYDGVDADCAGDDDYDQDDDGHVAASFGGDDCVDANPAISPSAVEVPYNDVDDDCDPETPDDDLDGDGFPARDDCDDEDPDAFPGGLERLGDAADSDCDGRADTAAFGFSDLRWQAPTRPRLIRTDDLWVIGTSTRTVIGGPWPTGQIDAAVLLALDPAAPSSAPELAAPAFAWHGELDDDDLGEVDLVAVGPDLYAGGTYFNEVNRFGWLGLQEVRWLEGDRRFSLGAGTYLGIPLTEWFSADVALDRDGLPWLCASDGDTIGYLRGDGTYPPPGGALDGVDGSSGCLIGVGDTPPLPLTTCDGTGACTTWDTHPDAVDKTPTLSAGQPFASNDWRSIRERDGVISALPEGGGLLLIDEGGTDLLLPDLEIVDGEAVREADGTVWLGAVADRGSGNEVLLAYGSPGALVEVWLPFTDGRALAPLGATVAVGPDRVVLAVTGVDTSGAGTQDAVGWLVFGR